MVCPAAKDGLSGKIQGEVGIWKLIILHDSLFRKRWYSCNSFPLKIGKKRMWNSCYLKHTCGKHSSITPLVI
jgi:hypothetical protein